MNYLVNLLWFDQDFSVKFKVSDKILSSTVVVIDKIISIVSQPRL